MKTLFALMAASLLAGSVYAADSAVSPELQSILDEQKKIIAAWAADPVMIAGLRWQNDIGPIAGMDETKWKALAPDDPQVRAFQLNAAGLWLAGKVKNSNGLYSEAFLSGIRGEKAAFSGKTTRYIHAGTAKFDVPMGGKSWQGQPEFDESSQKYAVQISTPVLDGGKPIGVLVVGIMTKK